MATNPKRLFSEQLDLNGWFSEAADVRAWFTPELATTTTGGGTSYTLTGLAGSYSIAGGTASLTVQRKITANAGAYSVTGGTATLKIGRKIAALSGSYSITGGSATLTKTTGSVSYTLTGLSGTYALSGGSASLSVGRNLSGDAGSYSITGGSATLTKSAGAQSYTLTGLPGVYQVTGGDAVLLWSGENTASGGYDDDKPKRKKRYVVKVDGKLVAFSSRQMALHALNAGDEAQPAQQPKKAAQPLFSVSLDDVRKLAAEREALAQFQAQIDRMRYDALLKMYEDWQDEQDIEDLLMAL